MFRWLTIALPGALLLTACGGGGGGGGVGTAPRTVSVSGTVSGLVGVVVLQNNGGANITVNANGSFSVASGLTPGTAYSVVVSALPELQTCAVSNGAGTASADVTNIIVTCADIAHPVLTLAVQQIKTFHFSWTPSPGVTRYKLLEDTTGSSGFTQVGTDLDSTVGTTFDLIVPLHKRLSARYILQACGTSRCIDSATLAVSGNLAAAIGHLKKTGSVAQDQLGHALALSDDGATLAVTAFGEPNLPVARGIVYLFRRTALGWSQQVRMAPSREAKEFGATLSLSADGTVLAVGAPADDNGSDALQNSGAVYLFTRSATGAWGERAILSAFNGAAGDRFGAEVSLSADGTALAVGAPFEDSSATGLNGNAADNSAPEAGAVYLYETNSAGNWLHKVYFKASNTDDGDRFGGALALSGDGSTLAVGAGGESSDSSGAGNAVNDSGAVYVFSRSGTGWAQSGFLKAANGEAGDTFGSALSISRDGSLLAVAAVGEDSGATGIDGNGADNGAPDSGAAYVFARSGGGWAREAYIKAFNTDFRDLFGSALALSRDGATLAVSAPWEAGTGVGLNSPDDDAGEVVGAVYVYARRNGTWSSQAYVKAWNPGSEDEFGYSVALSATGDTLAVGAPSEDGSRGGTVRAVPDNDDNAAPESGAIYLY